MTKHLCEVNLQNLNTKKHHTLESQEVCPFPAGNHRSVMNRKDSMAGTKQGPRKMHCLRMVSKTFVLEGLH